MSDMVFRFSLKSTYEESEKVPDFVSDVQDKSNLSEETTANLMLLLSEAVTNAIVHGNKLNPSKKVDVELKIDPDKVISIVHDQGDGFDHNSTRNPLTEENLLKAGGRGIFLIKEMAESVKFFDGGRKIQFTVNR